MCMWKQNPIQYNSRISFKLDVLVNYVFHLFPSNVCKLFHFIITTCKHKFTKFLPIGRRYFYTKLFFNLLFNFWVIENPMTNFVYVQIVVTVFFCILFCKGTFTYTTFSSHTNCHGIALPHFTR